MNYLTTLCTNSKITHLLISKDDDQTLHTNGNWKHFKIPLHPLVHFQLHHQENFRSQYVKKLKMGIFWLQTGVRHLSSVVYDCEGSTTRNQSCFSYFEIFVLFGYVKYRHEAIHNNLIYYDLNLIHTHLIWFVNYVPKVI